MHSSHKPAEAFWNAALKDVEARIESLREGLDFAGARALPEADGSDIVVLDKQVQLTVFRQAGVAFLPGQVLVTVQIARHSLAGVTSAKVERGLVFSPESPPRDATEQELRDSGT